MYYNESIMGNLADAIPSKSKVASLLAELNGCELCGEPEGEQTDYCPECNEDPNNDDCGYDQIAQE